MFYIANFWSLWYVWRCGYAIAHLKCEGLVGGGVYFNYGSIICRIRGKSGPGGICFGRGLTSGGVHVWLHALHAKAWGGHISVGGASFSGRGEGMTVLMGRINNFFKRLLKKIFKKGC